MKPPSNLLPRSIGLVDDDAGGPVADAGSPALLAGLSHVDRLGASIPRDGQSTSGPSSHWLGRPRSNPCRFRAASRGSRGPASSRRCGRQLHRRRSPNTTTKRSTSSRGWRPRADALPSVGRTQGCFLSYTVVFGITGEATRTPDLRIMRPPLQKRKSLQAGNLCQDTPGLAAHGQRAASNDPDLATVVEAWERLPEALRAGIMAMVKAASRKEDD